MRRFILNKITPIAAATILLGLWSCSSSRSITSDVSKSIAEVTISKSDEAKITTVQPSINSEVVNRLLSEARSWIGTKYRYGGNDRNGIDCSGFVTQVFYRSLGIKLPRTSEQQHLYCIPIPGEKLQPGDLVFFTVRGNSKIGHVGIYIGDNFMIHASVSKGVIITSLDQNYYVDNFYGAGRVAALQSIISSTAEPQPKIIIKTPLDSEQESGLENPSNFFD